MDANQTLRFPRTEREAHPAPPSCFPRTTREAGWAPIADEEWKGKENGSGIVGVLFSALLGTVLLFVFLVAVLSLGR